MTPAPAVRQGGVRVAELEAFHVRIPLRRSVRHASHARSDTDNVVVRCHLDDGTTGWGEGVPREYVTGESIDSTLALLRDSDLAAQLEPCRDFAAAVALAERLRVRRPTDDDRDCVGNAGRCAVELALLDAFGRAFREPVSAATRLIAPELSQPADSVRYSGIVTSPRWWKFRFAALRLWIWGFPDVKVKVGIAGQDDVWRLKIVRSRVGWKIDLRVDANEAWSAAEAVERVNALKPFQVSAVEQPVPHADVDACAAIRRATGVPVMLDESLCSLPDAERAVERQTADLFNLRLSKCGGFVPSLRLLQFARRHGLGCQLGCQVGETALLSAAGRHFACSAGGLRYREGSYDAYLVRERLTKEDVTFRWGGKAPALPGPGLGVTLDPAALERVCVRKEALVG